MTPELILRELRRVRSEGAKHVTDEDLQQIADLDELELRRRAVRGRDWHRAFAGCLDGLGLDRRSGCAPDGCWEPRIIRSLVERLLAQEKASRSAVDEAAGCFEAAFAEGLQEALSETTDARLKDLIERRLLHALAALARS